MAKKIAKKKTKKAPVKSESVGSFLRALKAPDAAIAKLLKSEIDAGLPKAKAKMYHRIPVWFIGENAVVGFRTTPKKGVSLLFWNGQALKEPELKACGSFEAAEIHFQEVGEINTKDLKRWLKKAGKDIWDFASLRRQ